MADEVRRIGESAAARVEEIVAGAERTAIGIVKRAEKRGERRSRPPSGRPNDQAPGGRGRRADGR